MRRRVTQHDFQVQNDQHSIHSHPKPDAVPHRISHCGTITVTNSVPDTPVPAVCYLRMDLDSLH